MKKLLALLGVCLPLAFGQSGTVTAGGQPIPGVTVKATQGERVLTTVTDDDGAFSFLGMAPGTWTVETDMFGFEHVRKDAEIVAGTPAKIDLALTLQARGQVTAPAPGAAAGAGAGGRGGGRGGQGGGRGGQNAQAGALQPDVLAETPAEIIQVAPDTSNEAFVVQGTVSNGLQTNNNDFRGGDFGPGGFPGGGGDFGPGGNPGGPGGLGGDNGGGGGRGGRNNGGGGGNFAGGGPGGGGGGFQGGGGGGRGGGGGGGRGNGGGGRGGRGQQGQARGLIGNRSRQGANQIRIQAFDTISDSAFNAKTYSLNGQAVTKPQAMTNRYGFNIGGPAIFPHLFDWSNKLNFTVNYNGTLAKQSFSPFSTVPTAAERTGDLSAITNTIYDPLSNGTTIFAGNQIPVDRISPVSLGLLKYIPLPVNPGLVQNYQFVSSQPNNTQQVSVRLQYTVRPKDRLSIQWQLQNRDSTSAQAFGFLDTSSGRGQNESIQWTHNFSARLFNSLTGNFNRNNTLGTPFFQTNGVDIAAQLGIAGPSGNPINYGPPTLQFTNYGGLTDGYPTKNAVQTAGLNDNLSVRRGKHNMQFGGLFTRYDTNLLNDSNGRGTFQFSGSQTSELTPDGLAVRGTGSDLADFLLGLPASNSVRYQPSSEYFRGIAYSAFAQDDYRLSSVLSLTFGLRYDYTSPFSEKYGHLANLNILPGYSGVTLVTPGTPGYASTLVNPDRNNLAPRLGIAWRAMKRGNVVVRAGAGIYYNEGVYNAMVTNLAGQPPFVLTSGTVQTASNNILTLPTGLTQIAPGKTITNTYAYDRNYRDAYVETWNLGVQRDMPNQLVMQINYTGSKGTRLDVRLDPNQSLPGPASTAIQRAPIQYASPFTFDLPVGNSILHQGQFQLIRRMRNNLSFQLNYTLQKSIDDVGGTVLNPLNIAAERAISNGNHEHTVNFQWTFQSPVDGRKGFLANKGALTKALKDWTFNSTPQFQTGAPLTAIVQGDIAGIGNTINQRAEVTGLPLSGGTGRFFNLGAFAIPASGTFGNAGRNTITGPSQFSMNFNMSRTIALKERKSLEIQINSTNILNHPNITSFGTTVGSLNYGVPTNVGGMRQITGTIRFRM